MRESQESQKTRESQESQNPQGTQPKIGRIPALIAAVAIVGVAIGAAAGLLTLMLYASSILRSVMLRIRRNPARSTFLRFGA